MSAREVVEQTELPIETGEEPISIIVGRNKERLEFFLQLLENIRLESIRDERP